MLHSHACLELLYWKIQIENISINADSFYCTAAAAAAAKSLQSCPTLCDPIDGSAPGSPMPGILQARILEWVSISFSFYCTKLTKKDRRRKKKIIHSESQAQIKREDTKNKILQQTWSNIGLIGDPAEKREIKESIIKDIMAKKFLELIKELESPKNS